MSIQRKLALSSFDLSIVIKKLNEDLQNSRLNMINSSKQGLILKLHSPVSSLKYKLVIGPSTLYTTQFDIHSVSTPSSFVISCRKHLGNLSLLHIQQVNFDRTILLIFGRVNDPRKVLVVEMFGKGNQILCQPDLKIITSNVYMKSPVYSIFPGQTLNNILDLVNIDTFKQVVETAKTAKGQKNQLRYVLASTYFIGGATASIILRYCQLAAGVKCANPNINLELVFSYVEKIMNAMKQSLLSKQGFIYFYKEDELDLKDIGEDDIVKRSIRVAEFHPINMNLIFEGLYQDNCVEQKDDFVQCLDEYFNLVNSAYGFQNRALLINKQVAKHENLQSENQFKVDELYNQALYNRFLGDICILNSSFIDKLLNTLQQLFKNQVLRWSNIEKQMNLQSNLIFNFISSVDLIQKNFTINIVVPKDQLDQLEIESFKYLHQLVDIQYEYLGEEVQTQDNFLIELNLQDNSRTISRRLYDEAKLLETKAGRTSQHTEDAIQRITKISQQNINKILKDTEDQLTILTKQRPPLWFEKFNWFMSSDGYLVLAGRDAQSNELLVKKFMTNDDIFIHADVHGAACTIIKAPKLEGKWQPPLNTLNEAATYTVTHSRLWETGVSAQSYWVYGEQVSKTAPTGLYIGTGGFVVRGKRNFLDIANLKLALYVLYRYTEPQEYFITKNPDTQLNSCFQYGQSDADKITVVQTKKQKLVQKSHQDLVKDSNKEQRKDAKKERQRIIADMKFKAKLKRLEQEGRTEDIEKALSKKTVKQDEIVINRQDYCIMCGGNHIYEYCQSNNTQNSSSDSDLTDHETSQSSQSNDLELVVKDLTDNQFSLVQQAYTLSPIFNLEQQPVIILTICPLNAIPEGVKYLEMQPGQIIRSSCGKVIKEWSLRQYLDSPYITQGIKNIQDHQIMVAIPGRCQFQGYGIGKILQNVSKQQVSKEAKKQIAKAKDIKEGNKK
ncbi:Fibronectin-binding protein A N-terminus (FbpA) domain-containing protein [Spironucleus salmonicida]|uniref:Fibronectin-binding protein A N-terminus (FbpA) domain-containing protein n=1 Tax=Spironucleus salmonicida TaxID=348837 RepID=V6LHX3_9EUKA|nr:Fibronectin-binding protein A N-terminus (FbpA) domain-containing protein [Spironucleus salmonicida]|eukprot:EST43918.1 Fibronectin-binding protein A N-terminus (FbpA) domain-containing protein [Spironucleus salmonicida]